MEHLLKEYRSGKLVITTLAWGTQFLQNGRKNNPHISPHRRENNHLMIERLGVPTRIPGQVLEVWVVLTASFSLTTLAVAAMVQAVSCCTTWVNSVRSRFMNSKASEDYGRTEKYDRAGRFHHSLFLFPMLLQYQTHGSLKWHKNLGLETMPTCLVPWPGITWQQRAQGNSWQSAGGLSLSPW